jgi:hypothetical protein
MVMKCGWGPSELTADQRPALAYGRLTNCQKVSGSSSRKQATPKKRANQRSDWQAPTALTKTELLRRYRPLRAAADIRPWKLRSFARWNRD